MRQLQQLLESLKGSPVGFKLNIELNNFFLVLFRYHVDLWLMFLGELHHRAQCHDIFTKNYIFFFSNYCTFDQIHVRTVGNIWMSGALISIGHAIWPAQHNYITCSLHLHLCGNVWSLLVILNLSFDSDFFFWSILKQIVSYWGGWIAGPVASRIRTT